MINTATVTAAVVAQLKAGLPAQTDAGLDYRDALITRREYVNRNPGLTPWIGVYPRRRSLAPRTLGNTATMWQATFEITVVVQATSRRSGEGAEDLLEEYHADVLAALESDRTLGGTVDMIVGYQTEYSYVETESESLFFQEALITLTAEAKTGT